MGNIFRNSVLMISATTARNCEEGILIERTPRFTTIRVPVSSDQLQFSGTMLVRSWMMAWPVAVDGSGSPLSSRGWVL